MTSLREWFDDFTAKTGEVPISIVFSPIADWEDPEEDEWRPRPVGLIPFALVPARILDLRFQSGYGGNNSPNLCAWSENWVLFSDNYDGAEELQWVPRNPTAHNPIRPGGG